MKQVLELAKLDGISIYQAPAHVENLLSLKSQLLGELESLQRKKDAAEHVLREEADHDANNAAFSEFVVLKEKLSKQHLSLNDVSSLVTMISNARNYGFDPARIIELTSNLEALEQEKNRMHSEVKKMRDSENALKVNLLSIEQRLSKKQMLVGLLEKLNEFGFDLQDLESIHALVTRIAHVQGTDLAAAKDKFLKDMERHYDSNGDGKRLRDVEALLQIKEEELNNLRKKYQEKSVRIEMLDRLGSKGVSEVFKVDLEWLAEDLEKYGSLRNGVNELTEINSQLQAEELTLRHKLVALEDQRQLLFSLTSDALKKSPSRSPVRIVPDSQGGKEVDSLSSPPSNEKSTELETLGRALHGENVDFDDLKVSLNLAIDIFCSKLEKPSLARSILEHAKLALKHETSQA
jgi:hypothetical protein